MPPSTPLKVLLCAPRGFCAGVDRAIAMVEQALAKFGAPVYVRHEIVHNKTVVGRLKTLGAVFVEELAEIPTTTQPVIFSAHGVSKAVVAEAQTRGFTVVDATCPLVSKVHREAQSHHTQGHHLVMVGHKGHPEVIGTMGQIPPESATLVETPEQAQTVQLPSGPLALVTQTTLSLDETADIIATLQTRFPHLKQPKKEDICYATTNRQTAVKAVAPQCDRLLVVGYPNSSNSRQLVTVARQYGCADAQLVQSAQDLESLTWHNIQTLGLTAGASAPEDLVQGILAWLGTRFQTTVEEVVTAREDITFKVPQNLTAPSANA